MSFLGLCFQFLEGLRASNNIKFGKTFPLNLIFIHWDALAIILLFCNDILHYVFFSSSNKYIYSDLYCICINLNSGYCSSGYHYCTTSFSKAWTQVLYRFKSCLQSVRDWRWWGSLTMALAGKRLTTFLWSTIPQKQLSSSSISIPQSGSPLQLIVESNLSNWLS